MTDSIPLSAEQWVVDMLMVLVVCAGTLEVAEEGGGRLGLSLILREIELFGGSFLGASWLLLGLCSLGGRGVIRYTVNAFSY